MTNTAVRISIWTSGARGERRWTVKGLRPETALRAANAFDGKVVAAEAPSFVSFTSVRVILIHLLKASLLTVLWLE